MKKLLAVDGNSILNRAFYGVRPLSTADGIPTNAVYGTVNIISRHFDEIKPDYFAVAFDMKAPTFRHKAYEGYKANRHAMPEELAAQRPYAFDFLTALGAHCIEMEGFEADDILGTLSALAEKEDAEAYILTGDRDALQLISEKTHVILATNAEPVLFDEEKFSEKYGVSPSVYVDVKSLMGDSSDNIPGVRGIGEKTAFSLVAKYGSLDSLYENIDEKDISASVKTKLISGKESAYMSRFLAEINRNVPLGTPLSSFLYTGADKPALLSLCKRLEFT
ncbi:MAG: 5'-3' exonuclease H3TH domain-containing protein, partial [Eubacteriales bacterium]